MINLDPNRPTPYVVIDNFDEVGREGVYSGPYEDCVEFVASQPDADISGLYDIVPNWRHH